MSKPIHPGDSIHMGQLTARQHAALILCQPDSGLPWMDQMINDKRREDIARAALAILADPHVEMEIGELAEYTARIADEIITELDQ